MIVLSPRQAERGCFIIASGKCVKNNCWLLDEQTAKPQGMSATADVRKLQVGRWDSRCLDAHREALVLSACTTNQRKNMDGREVCCLGRCASPCAHTFNCTMAQPPLRASAATREQSGSGLSGCPCGSAFESLAHIGLMEMPYDRKQSPTPLSGNRQVSNRLEACYIPYWSISRVRRHGSVSRRKSHKCEYRHVEMGYLSGDEALLRGFEPECHLPATMSP